MVQADLDILKNLAQLAERRLPFLAPYAPWRWPASSSGA